MIFFQIFKKQSTSPFRLVKLSVKQKARDKYQFAFRRFWWCNLREGRRRSYRGNWRPIFGWRVSAPTRGCWSWGGGSARSCCRAARLIRYRRSRTGTVASGRRRSPDGTTLPPNRLSGSPRCSLPVGRDVLYTKEANGTRFLSVKVLWGCWGSF